MSKDWIEPMAYGMTKEFLEKMEIAYQEGQKERNEPCTTNIIDPVDEVKRLADKIGIHQLCAIARDMRGESDTEIKLREENDKLRIALEEAREAVYHNSKLVEEERMKNELYRKDGEVQGLKYAMRCLFVNEEQVEG